MVVAPLLCSVLLQCAKRTMSNNDESDNAWAASGAGGGGADDEGHELRVALEKEKIIKWVQALFRGSVGFDSPETIADLPDGTIGKT